LSSDPLADASAVCARLRTECFDACRERAREAVKADPRVRAAVRALLEARQAQGGPAAAALGVTAGGGGAGGGTGAGGHAPPASASLRRQQAEALRRELQGALADPGSALATAVSAAAWDALSAPGPDGADVDARAHAALCALRRQKEQQRERQQQQQQQGTRPQQQQQQGKRPQQQQQQQQQGAVR
jgi:hypothetical protein